MTLTFDFYLSTDVFETEGKQSSYFDAFVFLFASQTNTKVSKLSMNEVSRNLYHIPSKNLANRKIIYHSETKFNRENRNFSIDTTFHFIIIQSYHITINKLSYSFMN